MDYHRNQNNSNRNTAPFTTERQPENDINLLLHFDLLSIREPPPDSQYFDFGSTSNSPLPSEKPASHPSQPSIKCQYCNEPFPQNDINHHQEDCYKRKIFCATCAEMIPLEIFDYHSNTCLYNHDNIAFQYQNHYSHDHHDNHDNQDFHSLEDDTPPEENLHQDFWHPGHGNNAHDSEEDSNQNPDFHYPDDEEKEDEKDSENGDHMFTGYSNMYSYHPVSGTYAQGPNIPFDVAYGYGIEGEDLPERYHDPHPYHEDSESDSGEGGEPIYEQDLRTYEQMMALDNNVVKKGISDEEIKKFPIELYLTEVDGDARCTVCITDYESGETLRRLSCTHRFHRDCIDKWLEHNITCPICKKYLR